MEPIEVVRLAQAQHKVTESNPWLEIDADSEVAVRHVMIRGRYSRRFYVYAVSWVLLDRLPDEIRRRVEGD